MLNWSWIDCSSGGRLNWTDSVKLLLVFTPVVSPEIVSEGDWVMTGCWAKVSRNKRTKLDVRYNLIDQYESQPTLFECVLFSCPKSSAVLRGTCSCNLLVCFFPCLV